MGWKRGMGALRKTKVSLAGPTASPLRSRLYTADLESGLHYLLRVELAAHKSLAGAELRTLKDFVTVLAKVRAV